jgi:hypothetical protein
MPSQQPIYTPCPTLHTQLDTYRASLNTEFNLNLTDYHDLQRFSVTRPNDFWLSLALPAHQGIPAANSGRE